jgi:hypothetical protein
MALSRLELDFVARRRASPWVGRVLLAAALTVSADMGLQFYDLQKINSGYQVEFAKVGPRSGRVIKPASAEEVAAARETVQRLSLPWDELFIALESAASERVALAAIEPDTKKGTVTISGDGKDYLAALSYVLNLSKTEGLEHVQLVRHEQKANDPNGPVSFAVSAGWSAK